jgi:hypothetical protein
VGRRAQNRVPGTEAAMSLFASNVSPPARIQCCDSVASPRILKNSLPCLEVHGMIRQRNVNFYN